LSTKFNKKLFSALTELISKSDRVIINGDFWEGLAIKFDDFVKSDWSKLFPLLKQKDAVYVYGNHDHRMYSDDRVMRFCSQAVNEYVLETPSRKYLFRHGHEFLFPKHSEKYLLKHKQQAGTRLRKLRLAVADVVQQGGFGLFGPKILPSFINYMPAMERRSIGAPEQVLVCGHTHRPYINKKTGFLDIGFFNFGWANYMEIDETGNYKLISRRY
jgi:predicted phosphodiesterase